MSIRSFTLCVVWYGLFYMVIQTLSSLEDLLKISIQVVNGEVTKEESLMPIKALTLALYCLRIPLMEDEFDCVKEVGRFWKLSPNVRPPYLGEKERVLHKKKTEHR